MKKTTTNQQTLGQDNVYVLKYRTRTASKTYYRNDTPSPCSYIFLFTQILRSPFINFQKEKKFTTNLLLNIKTKYNKLGTQFSMKQEYSITVKSTWCLLLVNERWLHFISILQS